MLVKWHLTLFPARSETAVALDQLQEAMVTLANIYKAIQHNSQLDPPRQSQNKENSRTKRSARADVSKRLLSVVWRLDNPSVDHSTPQTHKLESACCQHVLRRVLHAQGRTGAATAQGAASCAESVCESYTPHPQGRGATAFAKAA
eukprot:g4852.t1